jgi:hypothetical protein
MSCGSESRLPTGEGSNTATFLMSPYGSRALRIMKGMAGLAV